MTDQEPQYDHIGAKYEEYAQTATLKRAERHNISRLVGDVTGKRVLDLACGTGYYTRWLKQHGAEKTIGVDISPEMIRVAAQQEEANPLGISYQLSDAGNLGHWGPFDLITAVWLFNNVKTQNELLRMFKSIYDNLIDGGRLAAYTINPMFNVENSNMTKYGINIKCETFEEGRYVIEGEFLTDPPASVTVYRWSQSIYEWAVKEAGFKVFTWQASEVAPEDIKQFGIEYWQDYYDNCIGIGLICIK
jgi:cyclopropane fatty-acyl-phospholipid synthase-like methyltransferase